MTVVGQDDARCRASSLEHAGRGPATARPGTLLSDRYDLGRVLGSGATATVRVATDVLLDRTVAVKLFTRAAVAEERLEQEAEAMLASVLHHPALVALLDVGLAVTGAGDPRAYLVLEYVHGSDLRDLLLEGGALPPLDVSRMAVDLAEALQHMHGAGFLHRDVKPSNVLVTAGAPGSRRRAKLTDFGISSPLGRVEQADRFMGTAAYLSPEQAQGEDAGTASDVYALGLVLLEALTGVLAFPGSAVESAYDRIVRDPVVPASVPARIGGVIRSMTERVPEQRCPLRGVAEQFRAIADDLSAAA